MTGGKNRSLPLALIVSVRRLISRKAVINHNIYSHGLSILPINSFFPLRTPVGH
jgi:hypothetical protein